MSRPDADPPTSPLPPLPGGSPPATAVSQPTHPPTGAHGAHGVSESGDWPVQHQVDPPAPEATPKGNGGLAAVILIGLLVAVALGAYGRLHEGTGYSINLSGFSSGVYAKAWLASLAGFLAVVQLLSAMIMYGKLLRSAPSWIGGLHRWSGRLAVLASVPVAIHCLYAIGFSTGSTRTLVHSLFGCVFYGAFVSKMLTLTRPQLPAKVLPLVGGLVFTALVALWFTSSYWLFTTQGFKL
jgi:hypothetical protein